MIAGFEIAEFNGNTLVVAVATAVIMGALRWIGLKSSSNNEKLIEISSVLPFLQREMHDMKEQLKNLITRPELESRILEIKTEQARINVEIIKLGGYGKS